MKLIRADESNHYIWGDSCDGWRLLKSSDMTIVQERVPAGKSEIKHYHSKARQFFFILSGNAVIEFENEKVLLSEKESLEIPPGIVHQFKNESETDVEFLVISFPPAINDRIDI